MAIWSIPFFLAAFIVAVMSYGVLSNADPTKAFDAIVFLLLAGALCLIRWNALFQMFPTMSMRSESHHKEKAVDFEQHDAESGNRFAWIGKWITANPLATASAVAWIGALVCLFWLAGADEHFWPAIGLVVLVHLAFAFSLAWAGKLGTVMAEIGSNYKAFALIWLSGLAAILAAVHGYEEGYVKWWFYPPFLAALLSILLTGAVAAGLHEKAFEAARKAYFQWHGTGSMILWGFTLVIVPFLLYATTRHEFFDVDVQEAAFILKWVIAAGFFLIVFSPVFFLAKKIK